MTLVTSRDRDRLHEGDHGFRKERIQMAAGWMVTVAIFKDDGKVGHITFAVAIADPSEAVNAALRTCAGEAAVVNRELGEEPMRDLGLKPDEVLAIYDDESDPIITRAWRH
jgi:hypothetical protein